MSEVREIFWRAITEADFFNIERSSAAAPTGGGGQSYVSISFQGLTQEDLGKFLGVSPPSLIRDSRPTVTLRDVADVTEMTATADIEFAPRYQLPNNDGRYRIARQSRQSAQQQRHPAWTGARGFPEAPDDIRRGDSRLPDVSCLRIFIALLDDGSYVAGFFNSPTKPPELASLTEFDDVFLPYDEDRSAGVIHLSPGRLDLSTLAAAARSASHVDPWVEASPEVSEAVNRTRVLAGRRPSGQGRRQSAAERTAIELRAMEVATQHYAVDWDEVEDVSARNSYDLHCRSGGDERRVEVKGTTGDGTSVLLTPNEVAHARAHFPNVALAIVADIELEAVADEREYIGVGGSLTVIDPWEIDVDGELREVGYEYRRT